MTKKPRKMEVFFNIRRDVFKERDYPYIAEYRECGKIPEEILESEALELAENLRAKYTLCLRLILEAKEIKDHNIINLDIESKKKGLKKALSELIVRAEEYRDDNGDDEVLEFFREGHPYIASLDYLENNIYRPGYIRYINYLIKVLDDIRNVFKAGHIKYPMRDLGFILNLGLRADPRYGEEEEGFIKLPYSVIYSKYLIKTLRRTKDGIVLDNVYESTSIDSYRSESLSRTLDLYLDSGYTRSIDSEPTIQYAKEDFPEETKKAYTNHIDSPNVFSDTTATTKHNNNYKLLNNVLTIGGIAATATAVGALVYKALSSSDKEAAFSKFSFNVSGCNNILDRISFKSSDSPFSMFK